MKNSFPLKIRAALLLALAFFLLSSLSFSQEDRLETTAASILHLNVADLDRSLEFYRDVLGMVYVNPPGDPVAPPSFITDDENALFRTTILQIPNGSFSLELIEWYGVPQRAMYPRIQDPGEIMLGMRVRNLNILQTHAEEIGLQVLSENGEPFDVPSNKAVMIRDPDGFVIRFVEDKEEAFSGPGEIDQVSVYLSVADLDKTIEFYNSIFGMGIDPMDVEFPTGMARIQVLFGDRSIENVRFIGGSFPGSDIQIFFQEITGPTRRAVSHRIQDPGGAIFLFSINDFDRAVEAIPSYGGLLGTDQKSVDINSDATLTWARDPNGMLFLLSAADFFSGG